MNVFKYRQFTAEVILWAVRWYLKYGISYRELAFMLKDRGVDVDHTTIYRWVMKYTYEIKKRTNWYKSLSSYQSIYVDETYIKIKGTWQYLYRSINKSGQTIDFYLSHTRNTKAAKRFLNKVLKHYKYDIPNTIHLLV